MIPSVLLVLALAGLASAIPQPNSPAVDAHLHHPARLSVRQTKSPECDACDLSNKNINACKSLTGLKDQQNCICSANIWDELNTCLGCSNLENEAEVTGTAQPIYDICKASGYTGLPAFGPFTYSPLYTDKGIVNVANSQTSSLPVQTGSVIAASRVVQNAAVSSLSVPTPTSTPAPSSSIASCAVSTPVVFITVNGTATVPGSAQPAVQSSSGVGLGCQAEQDTVYTITRIIRNPTLETQSSVSGSRAAVGGAPGWVVGLVGVVWLL